MRLFYLYRRTLLLATIVAICTQLISAQPNYTGNGGKGMSLTIFVPQSIGLAKNQSYIPALVQGEFVSNFSNYSAISILDWERLDDIYIKLVDEAYDDKAAAKQDVVLGRLAPTSHFLTGNITKTATGYNIKMNITATDNKMLVATYSGTFPFTELDNLRGIRRASLELLQKIGVELTEKARQELAGAAVANQISAQTALAKGVTAQRQGTEVEALSYYFQAAAYDPSIREAINRSSILSANIKSGSIGQDARNDIAWRKQWVARLSETERFFDKFTQTESMPYTLFYMLNIKQTSINYQNETVDLQTIAMYLRANTIWALSIERALQEIYDGLNATGRARDWGLANWPHNRITNLNPFKKRDDFSIGYELLNDQGKAIHRGQISAYGSWQMNSTNWNNNRPKITVTTEPNIHGGYMVYTAKGINVNDVTDNMTVRITTVNKVNAEAAVINGVLRIMAVSEDEFIANQKFRFENGVLLGFTRPPQVSRGHYLKSLEIPNTIWGEPVISIGQKAFSNLPFGSITIGTNITLFDDSFDNDFSRYYNNNGKKAGTYTFDFRTQQWGTSP